MRVVLRTHIVIRSLTGFLSDDVALGVTVTITTGSHRVRRPSSRSLAAAFSRSCGVFVFKNGCCREEKSGRGEAKLLSSPRLQSAARYRVRRTDWTNCPSLTNVVFVKVENAVNCDGIEASLCCEDINDSNYVLSINYRD